MQSEDMSLTTEQIKGEEIELSPFIPVTETLLRTAAGEIGTEEDHLAAQKAIAELMAGPIGKSLQYEF